MDFSSPIMDATRRRLLVRFGAGVQPWWDRLPATIEELAARWQLAVDEPVGRGNTSLVLRSRRADGRAAVLKLTPDREIARAEASALRSWAPSGRVPLVWGDDAALGALLLETVPGSELARAVEVDEVAALIGGLHRSGAPVVGHGIRPLADGIELIFEHWLERRPTDAVPVERLRQGRELARELVAAPGEPVLLHGDLHPGNVLDGGAARGLVAIDPRPSVGDAALDAVDWVFWRVDAGRWEPRSRDLALALGVDHERLWAWCAAFAAMLAASRAAHGAAADEVAALLALAP